MGLMDTVKKYTPQIVVVAVIVVLAIAYYFRDRISDMFKGNGSGY
jgi:hypothetical protein